MGKRREKRTKKCLPKNGKVVGKYRCELRIAEDDEEKRQEKMPRHLRKGENKKLDLGYNEREKIKQVSPSPAPSQREG